MSNFDFLKTEWGTIHTSATQAEGYVRSDPRSACFHARRSLELAVHWLYEHDPDFRYPYDDNLIALLTDYSFKENVPDNISDKAHYIRKLGNRAVHSNRRISQTEAFSALRELYHLLFWLARTYTKADPRNLPQKFDEKLIPPSPAEASAQSAAQLKTLDEKLRAKDEELRKKIKALASYEEEIADLRASISTAKASNANIEVSHDYTEAETRELLIDMLLREAGWDPKGENVEEYEVVGMPNKKGVGYVD